MSGKGEIHNKIKKILIRPPNWIGDVVMSMPVIENIRYIFPDCEIYVLAKPWVLPLFEHHPAIDKVIKYSNKGRLFSTALRGIKYAGMIRREYFDMAILLQNAFEAAILTFLGGVRIRVGYDTDARGILLTNPVRRKRHPTTIHHVDYYLQILKGLGWDCLLYTSPSPRDLSTSRMPSSA